MNKKETKWEYCEHNNLSTEKRLDFINRMGQLGWELCLVRGGNNYIFKRPLLDNEKEDNEDIDFLPETDDSGLVIGYTPVNKENK